MGRKRSTTYRTLITPTVVPVGSVLSLPSNSFTSQTTYYSGNLELRYGSPATTWTYHTPVGYVKVDDLDNEPRQYYYVHDHLGNVCAVWSADASSFVQKTFYYPSGVPISNSTGQTVQPNKYNGKPYEEMHGFDIYEYEFRNYYATIMRFTAMDPLCEQTPWQSPYVYAANNPVCNVDWMGLSTIFSYGSYGTYHMTVLNRRWEVIYHIDNGNKCVYLYDGDDFDADNIDYTALSLVGFELPWVKYKKNSPCLYLGFSEAAGGGDNIYREPIVSPAIYCGNRPASRQEIENWLRDTPCSVLMSILEYVVGFNGNYLPAPYRDIAKRVGYVVSGIAIGIDIYNIYKGEKVIDSSESIAVETLSIISSCLSNPTILMGALTIDMYYKGGKFFAEKVSEINTTWCNPEYVKDWFGWNYMMY